jgi:hypothetical protein
LDANTGIVIVESGVTVVVTLALVVSPHGLFPITVTLYVPAVAGKLNEVAFWILSVPLAPPNHTTRLLLLAVTAKLIVLPAQTVADGKVVDAIAGFALIVKVALVLSTIEHPLALYAFALYVPAVDAVNVDVLPATEPKPNLVVPWNHTTLSAFVKFADTVVVLPAQIGFEVNTGVVTIASGVTVVVTLALVVSPHGLFPITVTLYVPAVAGKLNEVAFWILSVPLAPPNHTTRLLLLAVTAKLIVLPAQTVVAGKVVDAIAGFALIAKVALVLSTIEHPLALYAFALYVPAVDAVNVDVLPATEPKPNLVVPWNHTTLSAFVKFADTVVVLPAQIGFEVNTGVVIVASGVTVVVTLALVVSPHGLFPITLTL